MRNFFFGFLYHPFRKFAAKLSPRQALALANCLGDLEYFACQRRNHPFTSFMKEILSNSSLEDRVEELKRKCFRYRYKEFIFRFPSSVHQATIPIERSYFLDKLKNRGICFPTFHFGFKSLGLSALGRILPLPLYLGTILKEPKGFGKTMRLKAQLASVGSLPFITPTFDLHQFQTKCLPAVANGTACYAPILDGVTNLSKPSPFLGGKIVLALEGMARFILKHRISMVPYVTIGDDLISARVVLEPPFEPISDFENVAEVEKRIISILEQHVVAHPQLLDWFYLWKNLVRFRERFSS